MIKNVILTGDTHGGMATITRVSNIGRNMPEYKPEETAIIILGDAGLNFYLNNTDKKYKKLLNGMGYYIYCVRGNHEARPELVPGIHPFYDENINGVVMQDMDYPNIRYLKDGGEYSICGRSFLALGGAYSVDKWYRLARAGYTAAEAETADPKKCGWFKDELLTYDEMSEIWDKICGKNYDFILSHTCPLSWEPTDLFLSCIDQTTVDKSMELWLDKVRQAVKYGVWCFGHYHADRIERPYVEQFYQEYETIDTIWERWEKYSETGELDWWIPKSPTMSWTLHESQMNKDIT